MASIACEFCKHGVPTIAFCRWCTDGSEPVVVVPVCEEERMARRAAIRAEWDAMIATLPPSKKGKGKRK
jgi:hypothetical protein